MNTPAGSSSAAAPSGEILAALPGVRAVTFDAAGTLFDAHPSVGAIYAEVATAHGIVVTEADLEPRFRAAFKSRAAQPRARTDEAAEYEFWRALVNEVFASHADAAARRALFPALWETFAESHRWRPKDDAAATLAALRERGLRLAVLSNWDARLHRVIAGLGWMRWFDGGVLVSSELGAEKPDPLIFARAADRLACAPHEILHVGDSPRQDAEGALQAGWHAALLVVGNETNVPTGAHRIHQLRELVGPIRI